MRIVSSLQVCAMHDLPFLHSALVRQTCHIPHWVVQTVINGSGAAALTATQHTLPIGQSAVSSQSAHPA